ncbi:MAG TPA: CDP-alcohol phosphatidyltransferase family protein [Candidatus Aminicenantes bacterium]|nr:CDP-alcohol phosphatidyltransferase family protein [Candidatus Aminicenantes bacterium]
MVEQAVILAGPVPAGRPAAGDPRRVLLGLGLLERMVQTLGHEGIRDVLVVARGSGEGLDALRAKAGEWGRTGARVRFSSPAAAELPLPGRPFLLAAGMAVFAPGTAQEIRRLEVENDRILVAGSSCGRQAFKGLALCPAASFRSLMPEIAGEVLPGRAGSRLDGAPPLAANGGGWVMAEGRAGERQARRLLRRSLGKPSDGFFSRHLNRRLSWPISRLLIRLGVRPNPVTIANLLLGLAGAALLAHGGFAATVAAGLLFQFVSITDGCDGEIARLTFRHSALGARLDNVCDAIVIVAFFLCLPVGLYAHSRDVGYLVLGGAMVLSVAVFYLLLLLRVRLSRHRGNIAEIAHEVQHRDKAGRPLTWLERLGTRLGFIYRKEFISLYSMAWCVVGRAQGLLWTLVVLTPVGIVYQLDSIRKLLKKKQKTTN